MLIFFVSITFILRNISEITWFFQLGHFTRPTRGDFLITRVKGKDHILSLTLSQLKLFFNGQTDHLILTKQLGVLTQKYTLQLQKVLNAYVYKTNIFVSLKSFFK